MGEPRDSDSRTAARGRPVEPPATRWVFPDPPDVDPELVDDDADDDDGSVLEEDLVGMGADLEPGTVLAAYRHGLFPMPLGDRPRDPMAWWSPVRRGVLELDDLRVSRSLRRACRDYEVRVDTAFDEVLAACADPRRPHGWIDGRIAGAYRRLHELGWAHSVETWREGRLVGGLYGLAIGGLFAGESMFHLERDASKVALVGLVERLRDEHADRRLIDVQWATRHLRSLGVTETSRTAYRARLPALLAVPLPAGLLDGGPPSPAHVTDR